MSSNVIKNTTTVFTNCTVAPVAFNIFLWLFPHDNLVITDLLHQTMFGLTPAGENVLVLARTSPGVRKRLFGASGEACDGNKNQRE